MRVLGPILAFGCLIACGEASVEHADTRLEVAPDAGDDAIPPDAILPIDSVEPIDVPNDIRDPHDAIGPEPTHVPAEDFDPAHLVAVDVTMAPADWDTLRSQTRTAFDLLGPGCLDGVRPDPFTYQPADVTVDGVSLERIGIRKKGFLGSLDPIRPALRLELDELVPGQRLGGLERLTLNNGKQDPSRLKQCLAYQVFRDAGVPAPRCAFAQVTVNEADLGLYVHVEAVKKPFLRAHFGEPLGQLWEGALSDFRDGWMATFEPKLDDGPTDIAPLIAVEDALAAPDDTLIDALDAVIDLDAFVTFWAVEVLVAHWDGYTGNTNNFFVYHPGGDDGRLRFIPWGVDGTFIAGGGALFATGAIARRLFVHPVGRARFIAELSRLLDAVWDEARYIDLVGEWDALTFGARERSAGTEASDGVAALKVFVAGRRAELEAALHDLPEEIPGLRGSPCARPGGTVTASFATRWNTLAIEDIFAAGQGTFDLDSEVLPPLVFGAVGAKAGWDPAAAPRVAQIYFAAAIVGAGVEVIAFELARPLAPGTRSIGTEVSATAYYFAPDGNIQVTGILGDGELVLESAGELLDDGSGRSSAVEGHFVATLFGFF